MANRTAGQRDEHAVDPELGRVGAAEQLVGDRVAHVVAGEQGEGAARASLVPQQAAGQQDRGEGRVGEESPGAEHLVALDQGEQGVGNDQGGEGEREGRFAAELGAAEEGDGGHGAYVGRVGDQAGYHAEHEPAPERMGDDGVDAVAGARAGRRVLQQDHLGAELGDGLVTGVDERAGPVGALAFPPLLPVVQDLGGAGVQRGRAGDAYGILVGQEQEGLGARDER